MGIVIKHKEFHYNGHIIKVHTGWTGYSLEINGQIVDKVKQVIAFTNPPLNGTVDGKPITVRIGDLNGITLFIDGVQQTPIKKGSTKSETYVDIPRTSPSAPGKFCSYCGKEYDPTDGKVFCAYCGKEI